METIAIFVIASVLLWAGLEKIRNFASITSTLRELGLPNPAVPPISLFITVSEIIVALAVVFRPDHPGTHVALIFIAGIFAAAGFYAIASGKTVKCSCFGSGGSAHLGKAQIFAFPVWIAAAAILRYGVSGPPPLESAAAYLAVVSLTIAGIRGVQVLRSRAEARGDRLSAQEMYQWLR